MSASANVPSKSMLTALNDAERSRPSPALRQLIYSMVQSAELDEELNVFTCITPKGKEVSLSGDIKLYDAFVVLKAALDTENTMIGFRNAVKVQQARYPGQMQLAMVH